MTSGWDAKKISYHAAGGKGSCFDYLEGRHLPLVIATSGKAMLDVLQNA